MKIARELRIQLPEDRFRQSMENGYVESFIGKPRDELPNSGLFDTLLEA